jgi:hypothetical protein
MVPTQVVEQVGQRVSDPIPDNPGEADSPRNPEVSELPGVKIEKFGRLLLGEGELPVNEMVQIGQFVENDLNDVLNDGPKIVGTQFYFCHSPTRTQVDRGLASRGRITCVREG